jgi:hypothetical protein
MNQCSLDTAVTGYELDIQVQFQTGTEPVRGWLLSWMYRS